MSNDTDYYDAGRRKEILHFLPSDPGKVLEIGCADGGFSRVLPKYDEYWGVEPVPEVASKASEVLTKVYTGTFEEVYDELPDNYFDTIICNDVIEHMTDHEGFLTQVQNKGKQGFHLVGSVPNVRFIKHLKELLFSKDWEYRDYGILDRTHYRFFTEKSFKRSLHHCGYQIERFAGVKPIKRRIFPISRLINNILIFMLGADTRCIQFGFLCKKKESSTQG